MVNINTGAVALTGTVLVAGVATTLLWKGFIRDQLLYGGRQKPFGRRRGGGQLSFWYMHYAHFIEPFETQRNLILDRLRFFPDQFAEFNNENPIARFTEVIERVLQKYNIDATACTQRTLCVSVRDASRNVAKGIGTSSEKIFDGVVT